jgi:hypothetical protein
VLVVLTPGGAGTDGLVDAAVLDALGHDGYLLNVARGTFVDEPALVAALEAGRIAGAGLDVFADEPHVPTALLERDDVVLLPHVGSATVETREAMGRLVLDNVDAFLDRGELVTPVGRAAPGYRERTRPGGPHRSTRATADLAHRRLLGGRALSGQFLALPSAERAVPRAARRRVGTSSR